MFLKSCEESINETGASTVPLGETFNTQVRKMLTQVFKDRVNDIVTEGGDDLQTMQIKDGIPHIFSPLECRFTDVRRLTTLVLNNNHFTASMKWGAKSHDGKNYILSMGVWGLMNIDKLIQGFYTGSVMNALQPIHLTTALRVKGPEAPKGYIPEDSYCFTMQPLYNRKGDYKDGLACSMEMQTNRARAILVDQFSGHTLQANYSSTGDLGNIIYIPPAEDTSSNIQTLWNKSNTEEEKVIKYESKHESKTALTASVYSPNKDSITMKFEDTANGTNLQFGIDLHKVLTGENVLSYITDIYLFACQIVKHNETFGRHQ